MKQYFSYDHEDGIEFHDTAEAAKARAEKALDMDRDNADEGWSEEVTQICWGMVTERVERTSARMVEKDEGKPYDEEWEFELLEPSDEPDALPAAAQNIVDKMARLRGDTAQPAKRMMVCPNAKTCDYPCSAKKAHDYVPTCGCHGSLLGIYCPACVPVEGSAK